MDSVGFWSPVLEDSSLDALLEPLRAVLGSRLGRLEAILGRLASWAVLNRSWAILAVLVACLDLFGPGGSHLGFLWIPRRAPGACLCADRVSGRGRPGDSYGIPTVVWFW